MITTVPCNLVQPYSNSAGLMFCMKKSIMTSHPMSCQSTQYTEIAAFRQATFLSWPTDTR